MLNSKKTKIADAEPGMLIVSIATDQLFMIVSIENHWHYGHRLVMLYDSRVITSPCSLDDYIYVVF
jgi:hypothetical protein